MALKKINDDAPLRLIREGNSSAEAARYLGVRVLGGLTKSLTRTSRNPKESTAKAHRRKMKIHSFALPCFAGFPLACTARWRIPWGAGGALTKRSGAGLYALHDISALSAGPETK